MRQNKLCPQVVVAREQLCIPNDAFVDVRDAGKPVVGVIDQTRQKPDCTVTKKGYRLEIISDLRSNCRDFIIGEVKTKALIAVHLMRLCFRKDANLKVSFLLPRLVMSGLRYHCPFHSSLPFEH